ncbi:MAG: monovalent cation/H(+) antiporter subunit G [Burkholderiales bacterium]
MSAVVEIVSSASLIAGAFFAVVGAIGLIRMPDCYTRMHAASVTETLGVGLLLFGLLLQAGVTLNGAKLVMLGLLIFFASPTATHALARAAFMREPARTDSREPASTDPPRREPSSTR